MSREPPAGSLPRKQADITNTHTHKHACLLDRLHGFVELADRGASGRLIPPPQESESVLHVFGPAQKCTEGKELSSEGDKQTNKSIEVMENFNPINPNQIVSAVTHKKSSFAIHVFLNPQLSKMRGCLKFLDPF